SSRKYENYSPGRRQKIGWPGGGGHPSVLSSGTVQGQRRSLRGRADSSQGGQDCSIIMATIRKAARQRVHQRIRKKVAGTAERPRLSVHFSGKHVYAQVIDDNSGRTLAAASCAGGSLVGKDKAAANKTTAEQVGKAIAERSLAKKLEQVVFDRGGFLYHGKVKALAEAGRAGGLKF